MQVTGNYTDFYKTTMLPALRGLVGRAYKAAAPLWPRVFNVLSSTRSLESFSQITGVNRFQQMAEAQAIPRDQPVQAFKVQFTHTWYGLAIPTSRDVVMDDKWEIIATQHKDLGWSCRETQEIDAWSTFNNAFSSSFVGPDSLSLCNTAHPLVKAGGTQSNSLTAADLDVQPLSLALTQLYTMKRHSGEYIDIDAAQLIVSETNRWIAHAIIKSTDDPTTADRSINPLGAAKGGLPAPLVVKYLTAPNAWFVAAEPARTGLVWFWRQKPESRSWTDDDTLVGVFGMQYKKSHGWTDYIGLVGNQGQ